MEFEVFVHAVDIVEYVLYNTRYDTLHVIVTQHTFHSVSLTRGCLSICKNCTIVTTKYICNRSRKCGVVKGQTIAVGR